MATTGEESSFDRFGTPTQFALPSGLLDQLNECRGLVAHWAGRPAVRARAADRVAARDRRVTIFRGFLEAGATGWREFHGSLGIAEIGKILYQCIGAKL